MLGAFAHITLVNVLKQTQTPDKGGLLFQKIVWIASLLFSLSDSSYAVTDMPFLNLSKTALVQPTQDEFIFAVIGDYRPARRDIPYPEAFNRMLEEIGTIRPSLVIIVGDAFFGYGGSFQRFKNEVARFLNRVDMIGVPFYNAIGNHEVTDDPEKGTPRQ